MGMSFHFAAPGEIVFGRNTSEEMPDKMARMGQRVFMLTGKDPRRIEWLHDKMIRRGLAVEAGRVSGEPDIQDILNLTAQARAFSTDCVLAAGGGSVIDAGKAVAAMLANPGQLTDYLEVIGKGMPLINRPLPMAALPTTAGTGAEVTRNAVITASEHRMKVSMRHHWMIPGLAVIDPGLMLSLPPEITASTGLDALTQLIEPFVTHAHNPVTDGFCREGLSRAAKSLRKAFSEGQDEEAREDMALASLFGGLSLANAKLGAVHGMAGPVGGLFQAPHGVICARLLPGVMQANVRLLRRDFPGSEILARFNELGVLLTGNASAAADDGVQWIIRLCEQLQIPPLSIFGVNRDAFPELIENAARAGSMRGNPVHLPAQELYEILESAVYD